MRGQLWTAFVTLLFGAIGAGIARWADATPLETVWLGVGLALVSLLTMEVVLWRRRRTRVSPVEVLDARYGSGDVWRDVTEIVRSRIVRGVLNVLVANVPFDPRDELLPGIGKYLSIKYRWKGDDRVADFAEGQRAVLPVEQASSPWASSVTLPPGAGFYRAVGLEGSSVLVNFAESPVRGESSKSGSIPQTQRTDLLSVTLDYEEIVRFWERKWIVGVRFRVENLTTQSQTLQLREWKVLDMPGIHDEVMDQRIFIEAERLAALPEYPRLPETIEPHAPSVGWLWKVFPHVEDSTMRRHPYKLQLVDGADQPYRFLVDEWKPAK